MTLTPNVVPLVALVVDDHDSSRYLMTSWLNRAGFHVIPVATGAESLALLAETPIDVAILDVNLPDIDGFKVCQSIKSNPATNHIPVLHVSSTFVEPEYRAQGLKGGADGYLAEPIDRAELLATVGALLRLKQAERDARKHAELAEIAHKEIRELNTGLELRVKERTPHEARPEVALHRIASSIVTVRRRGRARAYSPSARSSGPSIPDEGASPWSARKPRMAARVPLPASPSMGPA